MTRTFAIRSTARSAIRLDLEQDLNEQQRVAVTCGHGPKLVIAGAGSGKTRTITYRVAYLMAQGVQPSQILLATFTNKAAREMLSRVAALASLTGGHIGQVWGGTFHALGNRLLRRYGKLVGLAPNYSILDEEDQRDLLKVCISREDMKLTEKRFPSASVVLELLSGAFNTQRKLAEVIEEQTPQFIEWTEALKRVASRYQTKKREANAVDYDDLLRFWWRLLEEHEELATRVSRQFRTLLVDEYQDTNAIQAQIIERMSQHNGRNLMVVGDDAQSIYQFRGANYDNILKFPERNPDTEIFKLETNYRSTPEILAFTNASIQHNTQQHQKTLTAHRTKGSLPVVVPVNDVFQEAAFLAERILQLRDEDVPLEEIAVLYRAHAHSTMLQAELIKRGIPYDVRSGVRFFEQAHIKDVVAYLKVLENPRDETAWRRLLLMIPRIGNATAAKLWEAVAQQVRPLDAMLGEAVATRVPSSAQAFFRRFQRDLRQLHEALGAQIQPASLIEAVVEANYGDYLRAKYDAAQSRLEDLQQLAVFARSYRTLRGLLSELVLLGELYGQDVTGGGSATGGAERERLILSSIHQAKGLEWRVVFLIRMCEGGFPSEIALRQASGEEEERRVFYVAATRAKDELYLTHPLIDLGLRGDNHLLLQPSRFLQEIPFTLYEHGHVEEVSYGTAED